MRLPLIYVAGPYRSDPVANTSRAITVGQQLRDTLEIDVVIPHLSLMEHLVIPRDDAYWLEITLRQMRHCHAVFRIPGFSVGSDGEEAEAIQLGIPVFHNRAALAEWCNEWKAKYAHAAVAGTAEK